MATVRLPGGPTLNYREWGRPDGAVVLLLHGLTSSSQSWRNVAPVLGKHFRVIAPDARGHGGSEWTHDYSFELMRDDVARFMEQIGILAAIVTGHSMGAVTAYDLAATRPDLIRLLVLEEMPPPDPAIPPKPLPRRPDPGAAYDWRAVIAVHRWRNAPPPGWWERAAQIQATDPGARSGQQRAFAGPPGRAESAHPTCNLRLDEQQPWRPRRAAE